MNAVSSELFMLAPIYFCRNIYLILDICRKKWYYKSVKLNRAK